MSSNARDRRFLSWVMLVLGVAFLALFVRDVAAGQELDFLVLIMAGTMLMSFFYLRSNADSKKENSES